MDKQIRCHNCRQEFVPDMEYEFPNFFTYWHECMMGIMTQITVDKEKTQVWWEKKEMSEEENRNKTLDEFYRYRTDPLLWYKELHAEIRSENQWGNG